VVGTHGRGTVNVAAWRVQTLRRAANLHLPLLPSRRGIRGVLPTQAAVGRAAILLSTTAHPDGRILSGRRCSDGIHTFYAFVGWTLPFTLFWAAVFAEPLLSSTPHLPATHIFCTLMP